MTRRVRQQNDVRGTELGVDWPGDVVLVTGRDTQKLDRVSLTLAGRRVRCTRTFCDIPLPRCRTCPMLEQG